jgi:hypothetical protein
MVVNKATGNWQLAASLDTLTNLIITLLILELRTILKQ